MLLVKITDGVADQAPIKLENFLLMYPSTSFPGYLDASITEPLGWGIYSYAQIPDCNPATEKHVEGLPARNDEEGVWYQTWTVESLSAEEKAVVEENQRQSLIAHRNWKLQISDWTQIPDSPLSAEKKAEWAVYRQALRDLPQSEGFDIWHPIWLVEPTNA